MPALILFSTVFGLILALFFPFVEFRLKLWWKARNNYKTARGTIHLELLKGCLGNLQRKIREAKTNLENLKKHQDELFNDRKEELETAATTYLVNLELGSIPGIGPVLKDRVIRVCFDGTLNSLRQAWRVHGIGEQKAHAIARWVDQAQRKLLVILKGPFLGKDEINNNYDRLEKEANQRTKEVENLLNGMLELEKNGQMSVASLKKVHVSTFLKSYKGDLEASEAVANHLLGCFPEWGKSPDWFKTVMENYGHTSEK